MKWLRIGSRAAMEVNFPRHPDGTTGLISCVGLPAPGFGRLAVGPAGTWEEPRVPGDSGGSRGSGDPVPLTPNFICMFLCSKTVSSLLTMSCVRTQPRSHNNKLKDNIWNLCDFATDTKPFPLFRVSESENSQKTLKEARFAQTKPSVNSSDQTKPRRNTSLSPQIFTDSSDGQTNASQTLIFSISCHQRLK